MNIPEMNIVQTSEFHVKNLELFQAFITSQNNSMKVVPGKNGIVSIKAYGGRTRITPEFLKGFQSHLAPAAKVSLFDTMYTGGKLLSTSYTITPNNIVRQDNTKEARKLGEQIRRTPGWMKKVRRRG